MGAAQKRSKKREAILACIRSTHLHPSAEWVYNQLKPQIPDLSLATVYRNLAFFKQRGEIVSVGVVQGLERFDGDTTPHVHFICTSCGSISDLPRLQIPPELEVEAARTAEGQVLTYSLSFQGRCRCCAQKSIPNHSAGQTAECSQ